MSVVWGLCNYSWKTMVWHSSYCSLLCGTIWMYLHFHFGPVCGEWNGAESNNLRHLWSADFQMVASDKHHHFSLFTCAWIILFHWKNTIAREYYYRSIFELLHCVVVSGFLKDVIYIIFQELPVDLSDNRGNVYFLCGSHKCYSLSPT